MIPHDECDRSTAGPVQLLAEQVFDFSEGQPLAPTLGKTDRPVSILPELVLEGRPTGAAPALQLSLSLQPGTAPGEAALDLFRLYTAVNQLDVSHHGAGLIVDEARCDIPQTSGEFGSRSNRPTRTAPRNGSRLWSR